MGAELEQLRAAAAYLSQAREAQRQSGKSLKGHTFLSAATRHAIRGILANDSFCRWVAEQTDDGVVAGSGLSLRTLCERFEEMQRRRGRPPTLGHVAPSVYRLLALQLLANSVSLGIPARDAVGVTVLHDDLAAGLLREEEFAVFQPTPWIVRHAAVWYASDPRGFLRDAIRVATAILGEAEFAGFRAVPGTVRYAVIRYPEDPRAYLRRVGVNGAAHPRAKGDGAGDCRRT